MDSIIKRAFSPFAVALRAITLTLVICATGGAWAAVPTPVAVWDGNFSTTKVNGWTLNANGNTVASDKSTITITSKGFTITPTTAVAPGTGVTVLVKMSGLSQNANNDQILVCAKQGDQNVMTGTSLCAGAMTLHGAWYGAAKWNNSANAETDFSVPSSGEFYILFANGDANGYVREGVYANGTINTKEISGLRASGSGYDVGMITIGGRPASESERASNAVISRVMIYEGNLTQQQMKDAIDDMETTKSYSLQCQAATNKGGLNWANFQLPYSTHYAESGSASLNTDKALRQITIPWRPDGTVNGSGATSLYLGITDSNGKLLALSSGADISTVGIGSSSTFDFSQAYLSAGTQYRYWFLNSNSYSLGDTITSGIQMGCALYYLGSTVSQMQSNTMGAYCPAARYWCSNMTESEFTATAGGTAVSASGAYADDITLKGVADGKFTLGGALNAARITLDDADVTIEMDSGDSIKAQYLDNSSQKLVIDASNGATAVGTYTLFEGTLASAADANLEVTFPTLGSGYELYTTKTANKISYQVDRTAVNATLTLTADCSFSAVKGSIDWMDSNHSTLEIVNNQESPITLTFDEDITAGSITVSGTGTTIIESSNSAVITAGTVTVPSGSTFDATGASITTYAGAGTFIWTAGYPATVPAGKTYQYVGGATAEASVTIPAVTVNGTLKTSGHISITDLDIANGADFEVVAGNTTVNCSADCKLKGNIKIDAGATLTNSRTDSLSYNHSMTVDVYGTLAMGTTRWSIPGGCTFKLQNGAQVTGAGDGWASLDFINGASRGLDVYGSATIEGKMRVRANETRIWIADNTTLVLSSGICDGGGHHAGFKQVGPGTLEIHANSTGLSGNASIMTQGTLRLADTTLAFPVELQGNNSYLEVVATEAATVVPVNIASIANNNVTFSGAGKVNGTITKTSAPGGNLATALQSSAWTGTFVADWAGANGTRFDINSYGNANSVVEVTKLAGGYVSGSNANVTVVPTVKVSGTMTLDNGYSGKVTTFTKLTGSGTVTFTTYTCDITTLDNFTGTLTPTDSYGTSIGTINLIATPAVGAKVVTLGTGANIRSIADTMVSVNGVVDESLTGKLEVKSDGIYVKSTVAVTVPTVANTTVTVTADSEPVEGVNGVYTVPYGSAVVVTYAAATGYELSGTSEYTIASATADETIDASGTTVAQYVAQIVGGASYTSLQAAFNATAQRNSKVLLLANEEAGATIPAVDGKMFYFYAGEFTHGTIANAEGNFITTATEDEIDIGEADNVTAIKYNVQAAFLAVTISETRTLYGMASATDALAAANAGPIGTTVEFFSGDPASYAAYLPMFDYNSDTGIYTKVTDPVAAVYSGVMQVSVHRTLADAVDAAEAGLTVKLLANVSLDATVAISKTLTLDLNGYAITASVIDAITSSGALTIQGLSGSISVTSGASVMLTDRAATLTVSGVTLSPAPTTSVEGAKVKLIDGTYKVVYGTIFSVY